MSKSKILKYERTELTIEELSDCIKRASPKWKNVDIEEFIRDIRCKE